jgi:RND family efflux transporter MFP subunit
VALAEAEYQLGLARLLAPFAGRVGDVKIQPGRQINIGEDICTLIDPNSLEAEFMLLEQELASTQVQGKVFVSPVARPDLRLPATLDILNPVVDDGGLLRARARLQNPAVNGLFPGMNVTVTLESRAPSLVVLPKSAIVLRSGRTLVFAYDVASGRAKWQYVTVVYENDEAVAISEGVEPGKRIIIAGGLTLDHDSVVRVGE